MKKKLMICGCSFNAPSATLPGTSYGELLAKKLDWDLIHLARQGVSNGGIRIMIDEVIRQRPDFAIIAPTFHDRMEIPASAAPYIPVANENKGWGSDLQNHLQNVNIKNGYNFEDGIKNVNYANQPYNMICETIFSLAESYPHPYRSSKIDKGTQIAIKQYINFLYDSNWKHQIDTWIIRDGIIQLYLNGIQFFVLPENLWTVETVRKIIPEIVPDKFLITDNEKTTAYATWKWALNGVEDPGYHGTPESQLYLADVFYNIITNWESQ
jgi:hypothetical protein